MKLKLILAAAVGLLAVALPGAAKATVGCYTQTTGPYAGQCLHWPDGVRRTAPGNPGLQTQIPVKIHGDWNMPIGNDNTTFKNSWGWSGCGPGQGNMTIVCGELANIDPVVNTASYTTAACPIGTPGNSTPPLTRGVFVCISNVPSNAAPADWACFERAVDMWLGCNKIFWFYIWQNGAWTPSNHVAQALSWIDRTGFLSTNGVPNYGAPYWYREATKQQLGCHEVMGHALGATHAPAQSSCLMAVMPDHQNPGAGANVAVPFLYGAATDITNWHNHNDAFGTCTSWNPPQACPDYATAASVKGTATARTLDLAQNPWKYFGKKGIKVVVGRPLGPPRPGYIYLGTSVEQAPTAETVKEIRTWR